MSIFRPRRNTVTPEMRADLLRKLPDPEQVMAGVHRVTESLIRLAETSAGQRPPEFWVDQVHDAVGDWEGL